MKPPILILVCGNPSRGDDALGSLLAAKLESWLPEIGLDRQIEVQCEMQFNVEHAIDLAARSHVLFIDAACDLPAPYLHGPLRPCRDETLSTHATSPAGIVWLAEHVLGQNLPSCELLRVSAREFGLGNGLSPHGRRSLAAAWVRLRDWCLTHYREEAHA